MTGSNRSLKNSRNINFRRRALNYERYIANLIYSYGYAVMRSPASGSGKHRPEPDLIVMRNGKFIAIEIKTKTKHESIKETVEKVRRIKEFVDRAGCKCFLCVKFPKMELKCIDYDYLFKQLCEKNRRYVVVRYEYIIEKGKKLFELLNEVLK